MAGASANAWCAWARGLVRKAREIENRIRVDNSLDELPGGLNDIEYGETLDAEGLQTEVERWALGNLAARRQALRQSQLTVDVKPGLTGTKQQARVARLEMAAGLLGLAREKPGVAIEAIAALSELASHASEYSLDVVCSAEDAHRGLDECATGFVRCRKYENEFCHGYDLEALQLARKAAE